MSAGALSCGCQATAGNQAWEIAGSLQGSAHSVANTGQLAWRQGVTLRQEIISITTMVLIQLTWTATILGFDALDSGKLPESNQMCAASNAPTQTPKGWHELCHISDAAAP